MCSGIPWGEKRMVTCENITENTISKAKILIAESNLVQASLMKDFLELSGHEVILSEDLGTVLDNIEQHHPDMILIDRVMRDVNSTTVCRRIKRNRDTSGIPIIVLADKLSVSDKVASLSAGADDFISKPYDDEELNALICARLRSKSEWDNLKQKTQKLEKMLTRVEADAHVDPLTGLFNRRRFEAVMAIEFKRAQRYNLALSCLVLDLDHFKEVNDQHGHLAGDAILKKTAGVIETSIREMDVVARWGGEEFIILNPNTELNNALIVGEKIRSAIAERVRIGGRSVTASIGVAGIPQIAVDSPVSLVHAADLALYDAKRGGRNRVCAAPIAREQ